MITPAIAIALADYLESPTDCDKKRALGSALRLEAPDAWDNYTCVLQVSDTRCDELYSVRTLKLTDARTPA